MIKVISISEAPEFAEDSGWSVNTPYQVHVLDGADPQIHADGRIGLKRLEYKNGMRMVMVITHALNDRYLLTTQAMDALARRVDPKARLGKSYRDNIGGSPALYRLYEVKD